MREALDSYTVAGAEASFEENVKGRIRPGFFADFVILDKNPFASAPEELNRISVLETWVNGRKVYDREA